MRHPITGRRISREKYEAQQVLFAKRYAEMKAEEQPTEEHMKNAYSTPDDKVTAKELGISVKELQAQRKAEDTTERSNP